MNRPDQAERERWHCREMTVAHIRDKKDADYVEVIFLESARFYKLSRQNPTYDDALRRLRDALVRGNMLTVGIASPDSDIIEEVRESPSSASEQ